MSDPLRLAMVGTAHPMRGGLAQFNAILCHELNQKNEVSLFSFTRQYPSIFFPGKSQMDSSEDPVRYPAEAMVDSIGPWSWIQTAKAIAALQPDGLLFKYWMPFFAPAFGTIAREVKKRTGGKTRVVAILDNLIPHERRPFDMALTRYFTGTVDGYISMSASVREDLRAHVPGAQCELIPHPVYNLFGERIEKSKARAELGLDPVEPLLLFFGFVRDYKGLDVLLDALPAIRERVPARLLVLGEFYSGKDECLARIERLGIGDAVTVQDDYVPNEQVGAYFSAADVVVLPYKSATQSGIVPIAYQLERPVVCTDVGGLAEIVLDGRTGLVVPPEDRGSLARAVIRFYEEKLEAPFVEAVAEEKKKYSWSRMADAVEAQIRG